MKVRAVLAGLVVTVTAALGCFAVESSTGEVVPGEWNQNFSSAKQYAEDNNLPLVAVWSKKGCHFCGMFDLALETTVFNEWAADVRPVMYYIKAQTESEQQEARDWIRGSYTDFPFIRIYWKKADGTLADRRLIGRNSYLGVTEKSPTAEDKARHFIETITEVIGDWKYGPSYAGGEFAVGTTFGSRLEAATGTTFVNVPLKREVNTGTTANNYLKVYRNGNLLQSELVNWAAGAVANAVTVVIPGDMQENESLALKLLDADETTTHAESSITFTNPENSPKNPLWIGRRTSQTLEWGEWTMDLEVARAKAIAEGGYTLVLVGGSLWCPDCVKTDAYLVDTPEFKAWAKEKKVACVAIDIPNLPNVTTSPSLLSRVQATVSDNYVKASGIGEDARLQSGAGYIARNMISDVDAAWCANRNAELAKNKFRLPGWPNVNRPGVPTFVLMRNDESLAGRLATFASVSPTAFSANYITRLNELLDTANDATEEMNATWQNTPLVLTAGSSTCSDTLSAVDLQDVYKLQGLPGAGMCVCVGVSARGLAGDIDLALNYIKVKNGESEIVKTISGSSAVGFEALLYTDDTEATYYVSVEALATSKQFAIDHLGSSVLPYEINAVARPIPGTIGFESSAQTLPEEDALLSIPVSRQVGSYGESTIVVKLGTETTAASSRYTWADQVLTWKDGEADTKNVSIAIRADGVSEGEQTIVLKIETVAGQPCSADIGNATHKITLTDSTLPGFARRQYVIDTYVNFGVDQSFDLVNVDGTRVTLKKQSGALPSGLKLSYSRKTGMVSLTGTPKRKGAYSVTYKVNSGRVYGEDDTEFIITVKDPADSGNAYIGTARSQYVPLYGYYGSEKTAVVVGALDVSITKANKIKAVYVGTDSRTVQFSGAWAGIENGAAYALMTKGESVLYLVLNNTGALTCVLSGVPSYFAPNDNGEFVGTVDVPSVDNSLFAGYYTVTFPTRETSPVLESSGTAFLTFDFSSSSALKTGKITYQGMFPNGVIFSGKTVLVRDAGDPEYANIPIFVKKGADVFAAALRLRSNAAETCTDVTKLQVITAAPRATAYCLHRDSKTTYISGHAAYGGYYKKNQAPSEMCGIFGIDPELSLTFDPTLVLTTPYQKPTVGYSAILHATTKGFEVVSSLDAFSIKFDKKNGLFYGKGIVTLPDGTSVQGQYKGVILPGWFGDCNECGIGIESVTRPFGSGTFWFTQRVNGVSVKRGMPVDIDSIKLN